MCHCSCWLSSVCQSLCACWCSCACACASVCVPVHVHVDVWMGFCVNILLFPKNFCVCIYQSFCNFRTHSIADVMPATKSSKYCCPACYHPIHFPVKKMSEEWDFLFMNSLFMEKSVSEKICHWDRFKLISTHLIKCFVYI